MGEKNQEYEIYQYPQIGEASIDMDALKAPGKPTVGTLEELQNTIYMLSVLRSFLKDCGESFVAQFYYDNGCQKLSGFRTKAEDTSNSWPVRKKEEVEKGYVVYDGGIGETFNGHISLMQNTEAVVKKLEHIWMVARIAKERGEKFRVTLECDPENGIYRMNCE